MKTPSFVDESSRKNRKVLYVQIQVKKIVKSENKI